MHPKSHQVIYYALKTMSWAIFKLCCELFTSWWFAGRPQDHGLSKNMKSPFPSKEVCEAQKPIGTNPVKQEQCRA
jgi:hypothetical protein